MCSAPLSRNVDPEKAGMEKDIDEAVEFALSSPEPDKADLFRDVVAMEQIQ